MFISSFVKSFKFNSGAFRCITGKNGTDSEIQNQEDLLSI